MNYKNIAKDYVKAPTNVKIFLWVLVLFLFFCSPVKASSIITNNITHRFYTEVINYTLPLIKITCSEENMVEQQFSLKEKLLDIIGISFTNPYSIMGKEVCYLRGASLDTSENAEGNQGEFISLNPFKLAPNSVGKLSDKAKEEDNKQEKDLPNKEVVVDDPALKKNITPSKPEVLIYHSHNSEGYGLGGVNDTWDTSKNITGVGEALTKELQEKYGISVVHDETVHNVPDYNGAYGKSGQTVIKYLKTFGDFKLVIDLHRDSSIKRNPVITKLNGEIVAKYEFVMCKGNPHFNKNMLVVNKLISISEKLFPGLLRDCPEGKGVYYYNIGKSYYSQDKSNNAMLIEVGSNMNTPTEARATAKYLARIIAEYVNGKN